MIMDALRRLSAEWAVAIFSALTAIGTILIAYIKWRVDKGEIYGKLDVMDERVDGLERDFEKHLKNNKEQIETGRNENKDEHKLLFKKLDEIKNFLITGKLPN